MLDFLEKWQWATWYKNGEETRSTRQKGLAPHMAKKLSNMQNCVVIGWLVRGESEIVKVRLHYPIGLKLPYRTVCHVGVWGVCKCDFYEKTLQYDTFQPLTEVGVIPEYLRVNTIPAPLTN